MAGAVFLDRDGTIIEDRGHLRDPDQVVFLPGAFGALRRLGERFRLFIVTNQSGIAAGAVTRDQVDRVNAHVADVLAGEGVEIVETRVCPHARTDGCACIKPNPLYLDQLAAAYGLALDESFVIGDHPHDVELARNAGATGIYVLTGHGAKHRAELADGAPIADDIVQAADRVLKIAGRATGDDNPARKEIR